ncbi:MAG: hypothetical protein ACRDL5_00130 [Solirubrobacteraceae bacterium]
MHQRPPSCAGPRLTRTVAPAFGAAKDTECAAMQARPAGPVTVSDSDEAVPVDARVSVASARKLNPNVVAAPPTAGETRRGPAAAGGTGGATESWRVVLLLVVVACGPGGDDAPHPPTTAARMATISPA